MLGETIKQKITSIDIDKILTNLGAIKSEDNPQYNIYSTICHNIYGGGSQKLYYYKERKLFHCYTECGSFDIFKLLNKTLGLDFKDSLEYICKLLGIGNGNKLKGFGVIKAQEYIEPIEEVVKNIPIISNPYILDIFQKSQIVEWTDEGISQKSIDKYNIRFYIHQNKIVIPHYNLDGNLVGIRGRALAIKDIESGKKYMPLFIGNQDFSHPLKHNLYGLNYTKDAIAYFKKAIVFEGEKSVLLMDTFYGNNNISVAVCGSNFSKTQVTLLQELGVEEIIFAFDKQYNSIISEQIWMMKMKKILSKIPTDIKVSFIWDKLDGYLEYKDSPVDKGKDVFEILLKDRISISLEEDNA